MKKKIMIAVAMLLYLFTANAHDFKQNGIYYNLPKDLDFANPVVEVTYMGTRGSDYINEYTGHVVIPPTVTYMGMTYRVASIGMDAFSGCYALKSVVIPGTVEIIRGAAFSGCTGLTSVQILEGVKIIGDWAFADCKGMTSITIPESVEEIGRNFGGVFENCIKLSSVKCPARFRHLFPKADFSTIVDDFKFENGVLVAYVGSSNNVVLPKSFKGQKYSIGSNAFKNSAITSITIPEGVTSIGGGAFENCKSLTSITIPASMTSIGSSAFFGCSSLKSITIPEGVTNIGGGAFIGCNNITSIIVAEGNVKYDSRNDCNAIIETNSDVLVVGCSSTIIPVSVKDIRESAFFGCSSLTSITIPGNVETIGVEAFWGCISLKSVTILEGTTSIGGRAFFGCSNLTSISIPESVTSIGYGAFSDCTNLASVKCPARFRSSFPNIDFSVKVGDFKFEDDVLVGYVGSSRDVVLPNDFQGKKYAIGNNAFKDSRITSVTVPEGVTSVGEYAFHKCTSLTSISLSESMNSIGRSAFFGCSSLASITIPESVKSIGENAFTGCNNLTSVKCPKRFRSSFPNIDFSVRAGDFKFEDDVLVGYVGSKKDVVLPNDYQGKKYAIGKNAFQDSRITSITIPDGVTSVGEYAFRNCTSLTSISIPASVTSIGRSAFSVCCNLKSITIPESVTSIGKDAFSGCNNLTSVKCPVRFRSFFPNADFSVRVGDFKFEDGVLVDYVGSNRDVVLPNDYQGKKYAIGKNAFQDSKITSITIPESVTSIGKDSFNGCNNLTSVKCPAKFRSFFPNADFSVRVGDFKFEDGVLVGYVGSNGKVVLPKDFQGKKYYIGERAFEGNSVVKSVTIPEGVIGIGTRAFKNCVNLRTVTIPESVNSMGWYIFENCSSLETVKVPQSWKSGGGQLGNHDFQGCPNVRVVNEKNLNMDVLQISVGAVAAVAVLIESLRKAGENDAE